MIQSIPTMEDQLAATIKATEVLDINDFYNVSIDKYGIKFQGDISFELVKKYQALGFNLEVQENGFIYGSKEGVRIALG